MANTLQAFYGPNAGYALELYERYQQDPNSVDAETRAFFDQLTPPATAAPSGPTATATAPPAPAPAPAARAADAAFNRKQSRRAFGDRPLDFEMLFSPEMFRRASTYVYETALRHRRWRAAETRSNRLLPQHSEERR